MKPWVRWTVGAGSALVVVGIVVVGSHGSRTPPAPVPPVPLASLSASTTSADQTTVVFAMGKFDDPSNTFYELFTHQAGTTTWALATPPGVADNGGLVVGSSAAGSLTAGFLPSVDLTFSVLAHSIDGALTGVPVTFLARWPPTRMRWRREPTDGLPLCWLVPVGPSSCPTR